MGCSPIAACAAEAAWIGAQYYRQCDPRASWEKRFFPNRLSTPAVNVGGKRPGEQAGWRSTAERCGRFPTCHARILPYSVLAGDFLQAPLNQTANAPSQTNNRRRPTHPAAALAQTRRGFVQPIF